MNERTSATRTRLVEAALDLVAEQGFERTTVAQIARRAGLTERTYFRYFADKREVLFADAGALQTRLEQSVADAPQPAAPMEALAIALEAGGAMFADRWQFARRRQAVIAAHPALRERELSKFATLAGGLAQALRARGVEEPTACLTAEVGILVFKVAFERWVADEAQPDLPGLVRNVLNELRTAIAER